MLKRDDAAKKDVELERLRMAIRDNIVTPEVRANGFGAIDSARLDEAINQIGLDLYLQGEAQGRGRFRRQLPAAGSGTQGELNSERRRLSPSARRAHRRDRGCIVLDRHERLRTQIASR